MSSRYVHNTVKNSSVLGFSTHHLPSRRSPFSAIGGWSLSGLLEDETLQVSFWEISFLSTEKHRPLDFMIGPIFLKIQPWARLFRLPNCGLWTKLWRLVLQDCHKLGCSQGPRPDPCRGICPSYRAYSVPHFRDTTPATPPPRKANYQPTGLKRLGSLFIDMLCASPPRPSDQALKSSHPPTSTYSVLWVAPSCGNAEVRVLIHDMSQQVCHTCISWLQSIFPCGMASGFGCCS